MTVFMHFHVFLGSGIRIRNLDIGSIFEIQIQIPWIQMTRPMISGLKRIMMICIDTKASSTREDAHKMQVLRAPLVLLVADRSAKFWAPSSGRSFFMLLRRANAIKVWANAIIFRKQRNYCCCLSIFSLNNV